MLGKECGYLGEVCSGVLRRARVEIGRASCSTGNTSQETRGRADSSIHREVPLLLTYWQGKKRQGLKPMILAHSAARLKPRPDTKPPERSSRALRPLIQIRANSIIQIRAEFKWRVSPFLRPRQLTGRATRLLGPKLYAAVA